MKDREIIETLKNCSMASGCRACPYADSTDCAGEMSALALDLIKRKMAEIEKLCERLGEFDDEINRMAKERYERGRSDAVEEFAERMKEMLDGKTDPVDEYDIDEVAQEMAEGEDEEN